jgi:integrase
MARIRERSPGVWEITVSAGRDPQTRRWSQVSKTIRGPIGRDGKVPRAIQAAAEDLAVEARSTPRTQSGSVAEVIDAYIELRRSRGAAPKTISGYETMAVRIKRSLGAVDVSKLTGSDLDHFYSELLDEGRAESTVHHHHALLRASLRQAVRWRKILYSPADQATPPSPRSPEVRPPEPPDVGRIITRCCLEDRPQLARLVLVAALTGMRRGELCALRWEDVGDNSVVIRRSLSDLKGRVEVRPTKTHKVRKIALDEMARATLLAQLNDAEESCQACGTQLAADAYVWSQYPDHREPWRPGRVTQEFRGLVGREGIAIRFQDLRHFAATQLLGAGIDVRTVAGRLGHGADQTLGRYGHFMPAQDIRAAEALGRTLGPVITAAAAIANT